MTMKTNEKFSEGRVVLRIFIDGEITGHQIKPISLRLARVYSIDPKNRDKAHALWRLHTSIENTIDELNKGTLYRDLKKELGLKK